MSEVAASKSNDLIVTPGGPRRNDLVQLVLPGQVVRLGRAGGSVVADGHRVALPTPGEMPMADTVLTPGGYRPRSLVYQVGPRHALQAAGGRMVIMNLSTDAIVDVPKVTVKPGVVPALGSGWIAYAYWNNGTGTPVSSFRTTWHVPPAPATVSGQTIFLFNGVQNYGTNYGILQPVLQWGPSAAGGGPSWTVASWYVTSGGQAFHTPLVPVTPGDALVGVMTLTGRSGSSFDYHCEFEGVAGTALPVQNVAELLWCNETLEAYRVNQCSDYPATDRTSLTAVGIQTGGTTPVLSWTVVNRVTDCGQRAVVVNDSATNGEVDIYYRVVS